VCSDRYSFAVGLAASLLGGKISLLPSTHTPEVIRQMVKFAPDVFCLSDDAHCDIDLPVIPFPGELPVHAGEWNIPQIPAAQLAAYVFTSGSTGLPVPHPKTWGRLSRCVRHEAHRLGFLDGRSHALVGTVPAQHMYGFESTVLVAIQSGMAFCAERPFYPADIAAVLESVPRPRVLVSTPIHLRAVLATDIEIPALNLVLSATAPLGQSLARDVEQRLHAPLIEIYGSTETGQIGMRRTAEDSLWELWPDVQLTLRDDRTLAHGGHVESETVLGDVVEIVDRRHFLLHGRTADMVNIAGKRSSFAYLDHQLQAIPGVVDGAFFMRETAAEASSGATPRVAALVVAPGLSPAFLNERLRERIDAVFLPRPLLFVERLPRNATGKLPREALQSMAQRLLAAGAQR
jgi:acyl-coenzyme A synthetase/AMP-(fatty) acid ligase